MRNIKDIINSGLIEADELNTLIQSNQNIKIIDASFELPNSGQDALESFKNEHIKQSRFFDIRKIADKESPFPNTIPSTVEFESHISTLGLTNNDIIVIYGQKGVVMGPARAWWMFRLFGHNNVCILNGGLPAWKLAGYKTTNIASVYDTTQFSASLNSGLLKHKEDVQNAITDSTCCILDARPKERFEGKSPEPRQDMRAGHIPTSKNVPASSLIDAQSLKLKGKDDLQKILTSPKLQNNIIATCGSGVTACVIALAYFNIGRKNISVYDGSWSEWGHKNSNTEAKRFKNNTK